MGAKLHVKCTLIASLQTFRSTVSGRCDKFCSLLNRIYRNLARKRLALIIQIFKLLTLDSNDMLDLDAVGEVEIADLKCGVRGAAGDAVELAELPIVAVHHQPQVEAESQAEAPHRLCTNRQCFSPNLKNNDNISCLTFFIKTKIVGGVNRIEQKWSRKYKKTL